MPFREFSRRMQDDLPFYYWTVNERFLPVLPNFDIMPLQRQARPLQARVVTDDDDSDEEKQNEIHNITDDGDDPDDGANAAAAAAIEAARHHPQRLHRLRLNRREDGSIFAANRQYLPVRHHRSLRAQFHQHGDLAPPQ